MMVLCIRDLFEWIESHPQMQYTLRVAYLEVYNEEINDLLGEGLASKNLRYHRAVCYCSCTCVLFMYENWNLVYLCT